VTIAVNPTYPLSEDIQRKEFLMCLHDPSNDKSIRKYTYRGTPVMGLKQVNDALHNLGTGGGESNQGITALIVEALKGLKDDQGHVVGGDVKNPMDVVRVLQPFGVYNNRGTHDSQTAFDYVKGASTREIIGVNISNYCFMRDIFGVDLRAGDTMELHCMRSNDWSYCEFVPVIREHDYKYNGRVRDCMKTLKNCYYFYLGKVWSTPLHGPFNNQEKNVVGHGDMGDDGERVYNFNRGNPLNPREIYRNIEVELAPSFLCAQVPRN